MIFIQHLMDRICRDGPPFKLSDSPRLSDADTLRTFMREHPETSAGVVVHAGSEVRRLAEKVVALPWAILAGGLS